MAEQRLHMLVATAAVAASSRDLAGEITISGTWQHETDSAEAFSGTLRAAKWGAGVQGVLLLDTTCHDKKAALGAPVMSAVTAKIGVVELSSKDHAVEPDVDPDTGKIVVAGKVAGGRPYSSVHYKMNRVDLELVLSWWSVSCADDGAVRWLRAMAKRVGMATLATSAAAVRMDAPIRLLTPAGGGGPPVRLLAPTRPMVDTAPRLEAGPPMAAPRPAVLGRGLDGGAVETGAAIQSDRRPAPAAVSVVRPRAASVDEALAVLLAGIRGALDRA